MAAATPRAPSDRAGRHEDQDASLSALGSIDPVLAWRLSELLREGGVPNMAELLRALEMILRGDTPEPRSVVTQLPWRILCPGTGGRIPAPELVLCSIALCFRPEMMALAKALNARLRAAGLCPRA